MKKEKIFEVKGIKCDTLHCNYSDDSVLYEDYPKWVNKLCPKCSGNLLTEKDYKALLNFDKITSSWFFQFLFKLERFISKLFRFKLKETKFSMDGSGKFKKD